MLAGEPPFDAIHVGAAADELHALLVRALAPGGRMVIPIGPRYSSQVGLEDFGIREAVLLGWTVGDRLGLPTRQPARHPNQPTTNPKTNPKVLTVVDKAPDGSVTSRQMMHVGYVPLTRPSEMEDGYTPY
jgi:hypothetical protein